MSNENETAVETLLPVLGRVPSGIFILTAAHDGNETGMLASWVMQAGFDPPSLTVAVKKGRYVADWLDAGATFALNVVAEEGKSLLGHFGKGFEPDAPAFEGLEIARDESGTPLLTDGSLGHLLCQAQGHVDSGDHRIYLANVVGGDLTSGESGEAKPMVHVRKTGAHY